MRRRDETNTDVAPTSAPDGAPLRGFRRPGPALAPVTPARDETVDGVGGGTGAWVERWGKWSWTPLPVVVAVAMGAVLWGPSRVVESPAVLLVLQGLFLGGGGLFVAWVAAWSVAKRPSLPVLLLGAGSLVMGAVGLVAALGVPMRQINAALTVHNAGMMFAGACHLLAGLTMGRRLGGRLPLGRDHAPGGLGLAIAYTAAAVGVVLWSMAAFLGLTPVFVVNAGGPEWTTTTVRQVVLGGGVGLFALSAAVIGVASSSRGGAFGRWYATGAALMSGGLLTVALDQVGTPLGWVGRAAQYLGAAHMVMAVLAASRGAGAWEKGLHAALREAERDAEDQAARLRTLAEAAPQIAFVMEADGQTGYANSRWEEYFGIGFEEASKRRWVGTIHADDYRWVVPKWEDCVERGAVFEAEYRLPRKDGAVRWHLCRSVPVMEPGGRVAGWCGTLTDIHEIKEASERARLSAEREREANRRTREIVESVSDGLMVLDRSWTVTFVNERGDALARPVASGVRPGEPLTGHGFFELFPEARGTAFEAAYRRAMETREVQEVEAVYPPHGRAYAVRVYPSREGGISLYYLDVTERKAAADAVRVSRERLELGVRVAGLGLAEIDYATGQTRLSEEAARMFGLGDGSEPVEVPRERVHASFHPDDREEMEGLIVASMDPSGPGYFERDHRVVHGDGSVRWLRVRKQVEFEGEGAARVAARATMAALDVTAEKSAAEALRRSELFLRGVLDSLPQHVVVLDGRGVVRAVNEPWERFAEANGGTVAAVSRGAEYLEVCRRAVASGDSSAAEVLSRLEDLFAGRCDDCVAEYPCPTSTGEVRWFMLHARRAPVGVEGADGVIMSHVDITDRRRAEAALSESEVRHRRMFELNPQPMWVYDRETLRFLAVNDAAVAKYGWRREEFLGMTIADIRPPEDVERLRTAVADLKGLVENPGVWRHRTRDGRELEVEINAHPMEFEGRAAVLIMALDVTERRRAERALRESEERFRTMADGLPAVVWVHDETGAQRFVNKTFAEFFGVESAEMTGDKWVELTHPVDGAAYVEKFAECVRERKPFTASVRAKRRDGEWRVMESYGRPRFGAGGEFLGFIGASFDVTERVRAEEAVRKSEERLRLARDAAEVGIHDWDIAADQVDWDDRVRRMWGVDAGAVINFETFMRGLHPEDLQGTIDAVKRATDPAGDGRYLAEYRVRNLADGTVRRVAATGTVTFSGGKAVRLVGTTTDVTRQRDAEDALRRATGDLEQANADLTRANKAKDEFLAALSHELRTPLTPVLLLTGEMLRDETLSAQARADLTTIRHNVELEVRLIDDLLDLTRITRGKLELRTQNTDLHAIIDHAIDTCYDEVFTNKRLKLDRRLQAGEHAVRGDPARLGQVVWNLVKNAVKFTPDGGTITVRTWNPSPGRVAVEVRDTGVGIAPEVLPTIFDAFEQGGKTVTRQFGGLGLGLAIARAMVQMHGGTIRADSAGVGDGAAFTVELPTAAKPGPVVPASSGETPAAPVRTLRILLVEDHEVTRRIMRRLLTAMGCEVTDAGCVEDAVAAARASVPDLIVSDVGLPDGTGHDVMTRVRELRDVPGIALSGYGTDADIARSKEAGFSEHLVKPVEFDRLKEAIARVAPR